MLTEKTDWEYCIWDVHLTGPLFLTKDRGNRIRYDLIIITYDISFFVVLSNSKMNVSSFLAAPTTSSFRYLHNETYRSGTLRSVKPTPTKSWPLTKDEIAQLQHSIAQRCPLKVADSDADGLSQNI